MNKHAEQRVKIAQKVINLLVEKKLTAITNRYTIVGKDYCKACAIGALIIATAALMLYL